MDGEKKDAAGVRVKIRKAREHNEDVRVVIAADKAVTHGRVVGIIDLVRKEGVAKFAINIDAEEEK